MSDYQRGGSGVLRSQVGVVRDDYSKARPGLRKAWLSSCKRIRPVPGRANDAGRRTKVQWTREGAGATLMLQAFSCDSPPESGRRRSAGPACQIPSPPRILQAGPASCRVATGSGSSTAGTPLPSLGDRGAHLGNGRRAPFRTLTGKSNHEDLTAHQASAPGPLQTSVMTMDS
jgi:hypothetical protein